MMKKSLIFSTLVVCLALSTACSKKTSPSAAPGDAVATINGSAITMGELDSEIKNQMQRIDLQIYQIRRQGLGNLIEKKLIEGAAKKKGQDIETYLKEEVDSKIEEPTEEEVKNLYDARKNKDTLPFEKVKEQIITYLKQSKKNKALEDLVARLKGEADVKTFLEPPRTDIDTGDAPSIGPKNAKVTLIEFSDYQCPFCKRVRQTIWKLVDEDYKDKIRYVFLDYPLPFHQFAKKAHEAAHCAGEQGKYFDYNKKLFDSQSNLTIADLKKYAKQLNLNSSKFDKCLDGGKFAEVVEKGAEIGSEAGVTGTPAYFINGIQLSGAQPLSAFKEIIDEELKK